MRMFRISLRELSWSVYDVANSAFALVVMTTLFPIYYSEFIVPEDLPAAYATGSLGFANSIAGLCIAVGAPLLGAFADAKHARKTGLFIAVVLGVSATLLLGGTGCGMTVLALILYALGVVAFTGGNVFYDSMLLDVTSRRRSDFISGFGYALGYVGSVIPFCLVLALIAVFGTEIGIFQAGFRITAVWWALFSIPLFLFVRQRPVGVSRQSSFRKAVLALKQTFHEIRKNRNLAFFLLAYFFYIDGVDTVIVMAVPYGAEIGLDANALVLIILGIQLVAFPFALLYGYLAGRFHCRSLILFAVGIYSIVVLLAALLPYFGSQNAKLAVFMSIALLVAANQGGIQSLSRSLFSRLIPREKASEYFGFYNICGKCATVIGPFLVGLSGRLLGQSNIGILALLALFGAGAFLLTRVNVES